MMMRKGKDSIYKSERFAFLTYMVCTSWGGMYEKRSKAEMMTMMRVVFFCFFFFAVVFQWIFFLVIFLRDEKDEQ
jgi:hypothetical protein